MKKSCPHCLREFESPFQKGGHVSFCLKNPNRKIAGGWATIRARLLKERGRICEQCGWDKINPSIGVCPVEVDHIDGNRKNNKDSNLKVLCPNCHSLTATYKHFRPHTDAGKKRISEGLLMLA